MSLATPQTALPGGPSHLAGMPRWPNKQTFEKMSRSPRLPIKAGRRGDFTIYTDRVRAAPALSPTLSMNIGMTAIVLGTWGALFPNHVRETLGIRAATPVVQAVFGVRELWTGFTLAGDPTRSDVLWARVAGDVFDIAVLAGLDRPSNPKRRTARLTLGLVLAVTALDLITAARMSNVHRNATIGGRA